jgi:hypothetical protein
MPVDSIPAGTTAGILKPPTWPEGVDKPCGGAAAQLWASDIRYMNDFHKLRRGAKLLRNYLRAEAHKNVEDETAPTFKTLANQLDVGIFETVARHLRVFATCFCADGDLLSQWRGYAGGVGGYAIGFRTEVLLSHARALP